MKTRIDAAAHSPIPPVETETKEVAHIEPKSKRQDRIDKIVALVGTTSDVGLAVLLFKSREIAEMHPRYSTTSAEIISLVAWRESIDKAVDQQRGQ